ncbi:MAG TPA: hypothetical protein VEC06_18780 [Paucimonas sp.]|nr:hypothetical protein [Paucimonas sp.]
MKRLVAIGFVIIALMAVLLFWSIDENLCENESPYHFSGKCLAVNVANAEKNDANAMYNLALYYERTNLTLSKQWLVKAIHAGSQLAQARILDECGSGKLFSVSEAERMLSEHAKSKGKSELLHAMYFYLGGSCHGINIDHARRFYREDFDSGLMLCPVARKYANLVLEGQGKDNDRKISVDLLTKCMRNSAVGSDAFVTAERLLKSLN